MNVFSTAKSGGPGGKVARALHNLDVSQPAVHRLLQAAEVIGWKSQSPANVGDAIAHVAFPKYKIAVYVMSDVWSTGSAHIIAKKALWDKEGWKLLVVRKGQLNKYGASVIGDMLKEIVLGRK